jgi:predicted kinase
MDGDIRKVEALRTAHPLVWNRLTIEQKRIALANALSLSPKDIEKAIRLAKKYDLPKEAKDQVA